MVLWSPMPCRELKTSSESWMAYEASNPGGRPFLEQPSCQGCGLHASTGLSTVCWQVFGQTVTPASKLAASGLMVTPRMSLA